MKKLLIFLVGLLLSFAAGSATIQVPVSKLRWDNPAGNIGVVSMRITCGTQSLNLSDAAQLASGSPGEVLLSSVIKTDGTYTCVARYVGANGESVDSSPTVPVTRAGGNFTVAVYVPDAPANFRAE
ncbi:MAG: hypothetical protein AB1560_02045 [Pseudomonadota bacterium]